MDENVHKLPTKPAGRPRKNQVPRAEQVHGRILDAIRNGQFPPGHRLRETEIATWLEVSRTPVREALRRMESEGLVTVESWRGVVVSALDHQQVSELYAMWESIEGTAAGLAARHIDEAELEMLDLLLDKSADNPSDAQQQSALNRQFHGAIYGAAHNRYLIQTQAQLQNAAVLLPGTTYSVAGRGEQALAEHRAVVAAIRSRNAAEAEAAARAHIQSEQRCRLRMMLEEQIT